MELPYGTHLCGRTIGCVRSEVLMTVLFTVTWFHGIVGRFQNIGDVNTGNAAVRQAPLVERGHARPEPI